MAELPEAGAKLTLDLSEWEANWSSATDQAAELQSTIDDLGGGVDVSIDISTSGDDSVDQLESLDGETIAPELNTTETPQGKQVREGINFLATMKKIEVAIDIIGTAIDFVKDVGNLAVTPFLDVEDAVAKINAQTGSGTGIDDLGQFIRDTQAADLGDSVDQIADVVIQAKQLDLPIQDATRSALTFTHTWQDVDPKTVVGAWGTALQTGIVDNMQEASDLMTVFFQQGGNIGGDAIQVVQANAQSWADMGLNMADALSLMNSLQSGTGATATDAAKMMQTFDDQFTAAAADPGSQQAKLLKMIGIDNPKEAGQAIGADTFNAFADAFSTQSSETQDLISGLFFGKGGKKFTGAIGQMTTQGGPFADVVGAASDAATEIDNSLRGAIDDFVLQINTSLQELLSSDAIDLPGKIKVLKEAFQEAVAVLQSGGTVGDALEVALNIPGLSKTLDTFIGNFERIVGNLEISFLQLVAIIQDITGHGKEAAATRETIKQKGTAQFAFDLQLANPEDVPDMVATALGRGLSISDITATIQTALNESIAKANFDQGATIIQGAIAGAIADGATPEAANALAFGFSDKLKDAFANNLAAGNIDVLQDLIGIKPNAAVPGLDDAVAGFKKQLSDAFAPKAGEANAVNPFTTAFQGATTAFTDAFPGMGKAGAQTQGGFATGVVNGVQNFVDSVTKADSDSGIALDHIATTADTMATNVGTSLDTVNTGFDTTAAEAALMDQNITLSLTGNTVTTSFQEVAAAAAAAFPGVIDWFNRTAAEAAMFDSAVSIHLRSVIKQLGELNFLALQTIANVTSAQGLGGGGGTNITNNNVTVNNNVNNSAAAAANGYAVGRSLRGMG